MDRLGVINKDWKCKFIIIWTGQAVSIFTSSVIQMAIIWYLTEKTGSAAILSLATFAGFLPHAVLGPFIGVLVDRYNRKTIMIVSDVFIAATTMVLVISGIYGELSVWLIMAVLFARSVGTAFHWPSLQAVTPLIVPEDNLTKCAGYSQAVESVSILLSPAVAALLYAVWSINAILLLDVVGAAAAVFTVAVLDIPECSKEQGVHAPNIIREAKEGLDSLQKTKGMTGLMVVSAVYAVIYFPIGTLYPLICMTYFGGTFRESGMVEVAFASGMLAGSLVLGRWGEKINKAQAIMKSIVVMGIGLVITGLLPEDGLKIFIVLAAVMGITIPFYHGILSAIFQLKIEPEYLGRVFSLSSSLSMLAMPMGLMLAGTFAEVIGVENWFLISGILTVILAAVCFLMPSIHNCCEAKNING